MDQAKSREPISRKHFQKLAELRIREAHALFERKEYSGSYYLAGYSAECGFKAIIAKRFKANQIPDLSFVKDIYTHDLRFLLKLSKLSLPRELDGKWAIVVNWDEKSRYQMKSRIEAEEILQALTQKDYGIFLWIKQNW